MLLPCLICSIGCPENEHKSPNFNREQKRGTHRTRRYTIPANASTELDAHLLSGIFSIPLVRLCVMHVPPRLDIRIYRQEGGVTISGLDASGEHCTAGLRPTPAYSREAVTRWERQHTKCLGHHGRDCVHRGASTDIQLPPGPVAFHCYLLYQLCSRCAIMTDDAKRCFC